MACPTGKDLQWYTKTDMVIKTTLTKKTVDAVKLADCRTKCKDETSFVCKSVEFKTGATTQNCALSKVNRVSMTVMPGVSVESKSGYTYTEWICTESKLTMKILIFIRSLYCSMNPNNIDIIRFVVISRYVSQTLVLT
jgi:hypothetical protein